MQVLIAEDDAVSQQILITLLRKWGMDTIVTNNGAEAWEALQQPNAPRLAILDWMMPEIDGAHLCRKIRGKPALDYVYIIMLSAKDDLSDIVQGMNAGADDYLVKPYRPEELQVRIRSGERVLRLETELADRVRELNDSLQTIRQLKKVLPVCMHCKRVRDDDDYWQALEIYVHKYTGSDFSHGICPDCYEKYHPEALEQ